MNNLESFLAIGEQLDPFSFEREHLDFVRAAVDGYEFTERPRIEQSRLHLAFFAIDHRIGSIDASVDNRHSLYGIATDIRIQYGSTGSIARSWKSVNGPSSRYFDTRLVVNNEAIFDTKMAGPLIAILRDAYESDQILSITKKPLDT